MKTVRWQKTLLLCAVVFSACSTGWAKELVSVSIDKDLYATKDTIYVLLTSNTSSTVVAYDEQSYCTIITLEMRQGDHWLDIAGCPLDRAPMPVYIKGNKTEKVQLPGEAYGSGPRPSGLYRLKFTCQVTDSNGNPIGDKFISYSREFHVVEFPLGDTNHDGCVNDFDLTNVILDFGGIPDLHGDSDVNGDGVVDDFDLTIVITNFMYECR